MKNISVALHRFSSFLLFTFLFLLHSFPSALLAPFSSRSSIFRFHLHFFSINNKLFFIFLFAFCVFFTLLKRNFIYTCLHLCLFESVHASCSLIAIKLMNFNGYHLILIQRNGVQSIIFIQFNLWCMDSCSSAVKQQ